MLNRNKKRLPFEIIAVPHFWSPRSYGFLLRCPRHQDQSRQDRRRQRFSYPILRAMDKGFFKSEGFEAAFIATTGGVLVRAAIAKEIELCLSPPAAQRRYSREHR